MKGRINKLRKIWKSIQMRSGGGWEGWCVCVGGGGGGVHPNKKKEKGIDRVELMSWMENAPRNIPGILWPPFRGDDVSFPGANISAEVARLQQTATALPRVSSALNEPLALQRLPANKTDKRPSEGLLKRRLFTRIPLYAHRRIVQDADVYVCHFIPWEP